VPKKRGGSRKGEAHVGAEPNGPADRVSLELIKVLNKLIEVCRDADAEFCAAAEVVANQDLKRLFLSYARQRARYAAELQDEVRRRGGTPEENGTLAGTVHRRWVGLKGVLTGGSESSIVVECQRGEECAHAAYEQMLAQQLPEEVRALVARQAAGVNEAQERMHALEEVTQQLS
jgi:uncharacterized protein (TIGR02284 family)